MSKELKSPEPPDILSTGNPTVDLWARTNQKHRLHNAPQQIELKTPNQRRGKPWPIMCYSKYRRQKSPFFAKLAFKVRNSVGVNMSLLYFTTRVVNIGAGHNLSCQTCTKSHWRRCIKCLDSSKLRNTKMESIKVQGTILLIVKMGPIQVKTSSDASETFVDILLSTPYMDCCIK